LSVASIALPRATESPVAQRRPRRLGWVVVVLLLGQMAIAMVTTAVQQTPTIDEPVYVGATAVYLDQHSLRYNPEHPPLGKLIMATGLVFADVHVDRAFTGDQTELGRYVLYESGHDPGRLLLLARLPMIVLTLLFGLVVFLFARDLAGDRGGFVALALFAFSPDLVAHGSLATLDVPAAGFLLTSAWLLWRARTRPDLYLPLAGLALGAALATKMSTLAAVPVLLVLAALSLGTGRVPWPSSDWSRSPWCGRPTWPWIRCCAGKPRRACRPRSSTGCRSPSRTATGCACSSALRTGCGAATCSASTTRARAGTTCRPRCW
jgi:dolichyl-phosphate-mannose--protein O-mannosyl transferase